MSGEQLNGDDTAVLLQEGEDTQEMGAVPITIFTENWILDADAEEWAYTSLGVWAQGRIRQDTSGDRKILVPYTRISFIEFHVDDEEDESDGVGLSE